jgi:Sulfotransferase domain
MTSSREPPLPTFLIIGAQKSATRWLRFNLGLHPDVYAAPNEIEFFNNRNRYNDLGVSWYRSQFEGWAGESIGGEATPGYMFWRHQPTICSERVRSVVPDARLIAILRNPIDRAHSAMLHHIARNALPPDSDLVDIVRRTRADRDPLGLISGGWYAESLEPYRQRFGDQLLVVLHDDVGTDARGVYDRALRHVGARPDWAPSDLGQVRFSYRDRPGGGANETRPLTAEQRRDLYSYFSDDISRLAEMLGRDLSIWDP